MNQADSFVLFVLLYGKMRDECLNRSQLPNHSSKSDVDP